MTSNSLPDDIRRFLLALPSIPYLETILLLRDSPDARWTTQKIAQRLFLHEEKISGLLQDLCNSGICQESAETVGDVVYHPQSDDLARLLDRVATYYARNLIEVTNMIHSNNRNQRIQQFADAFQWRKGKDR